MILSLRKQSLNADISEETMNILNCSRKKRQVHRRLSYEQSSYKKDKTAELSAAKSVYMEVRNSRPDRSNQDAYNAWQEQYNDVREDYMAQKEDIESYYDDINEEIEQEAQDEEDYIAEEQERAETQRDALNAELQALSDQIKTEIQNNAIKF